MASTSSSAQTAQHAKHEVEEDVLSQDYHIRRRKTCGVGHTFSASELTDLMPEPNRAAILNKALDIQLYELEKPRVLYPYELLIEMENVGICGSDSEYYKHGRIADFVVKRPMIMGHESGGRVIAVGAGDGSADSLSNTNELNPHAIRVGDRVAIEPGLPCGECEHCVSSNYNLCPEVAFLATPPVHGCMRKYLTRPADWCYKIAAHMTSEDAAFCEPLSVGIHSTGPNIANIQANATAAVFGAGPIGIITMLCAVYRGAKRIVITDVVQQKLDVVDAYVRNNIDGARCQVFTLNTSSLGSDEALARKVRELLTDEEESGAAAVPCSGADHSFECVGHSAVLNQALLCTKRGGMITVIGMAANPEMLIKIDNCNVHEKTINGVFRYRDTYPSAIDMLSSGVVGDVKELITLRADAWNETELRGGMEKINENVKIMYQL